MKKIDLISTFVKAEILNMEFIAIYLETPAGNVSFIQMLIQMI